MTLSLNEYNNIVVPKRDLSIFTNDPISSKKYIKTLNPEYMARHEFWVYYCLSSGVSLKIRTESYHTIGPKGDLDETIPKLVGDGQV